MNNNFYIKPGYKINSTNLTLDTSSGLTYWNPERIQAAHLFQSSVYWWGKKLIQKHNAVKIADIGCGAGFKLAKIANELKEGRTFTGIDQSSAIKFCEKTHKGVTWIAQDLSNTDLDSSIKFDFIICSDVIEHLENPDLLLSFIKQRLLPGGHVLLSTPDRDLFRGVSCNHSPNPNHIREWNEAEFRSYVSANNFVICETRWFLPIPFGFTRLFYREVVRRVFRRKNVRYNMALLLKVQA